MNDQILNKFFYELGKINIIYFLLRAYKATDKDVDLMFFSKDLKALESVINAFNGIKVESALHLPHIQYHIPYIEFGVVKYLVIDCGFDLIFGKNMNKIEVSLDRQDFINKIHKVDDKFLFPSFEYATIFLAIHIFIENKSNKDDPRFGELVEYIRKSDKGDLENATNHFSIESQNIPLLSVDNIENVFKKIVVRKSNKLKFYLFKVFSFCKRRFLMRKGLTVAFIGVDGTGKSALCDELFKSLSLNINEIVKVEYMGDRRSNKKIEKLKNDYRKQIGKSSLIFITYKAINTLVYLIRRLILSYKLYLNSKNQIILLDRFILDRLMPSPNTRKINPFQIKILRVFKHFIKLPDIIYFLDGDAQKISARKAEYSYTSTLNGIEFQREVLDKSDLSYVNLNTTENSIKELHDKILIDIANKIRHKLHNA
jgi:thymidylate kinase